MLNPRDAWQATLGQLQLQLNRATFDTWLKGAELIAYEDGEFVIRVRHAYAKDWLEKHLDHVITQTLGGIFGRSVQVRYIVHIPARRTLDENADTGPLFSQLGQDGHASKGDQNGQDQQANATIGTPAPAETDSALVPDTNPASPTTRDTASPRRSPARVSPSTSGESALQPTRSAIEQALDIIEQAASAGEHRTDYDWELDDYEEWDPRFREQDSPRESQPVELPPVHLNDHYTFKEFVGGPNNQFALAAAKAVAEGVTTYNPLYIHGGVGQGKSHLLQAIGHKAVAAGRRVAYVTGESFVNELVSAIRTHSMEDFRARYRTVDLLLVDDIHFLAGKAASEAEFDHTFNTIFSRNGQIVVTGDRLPRDITALDERVRSRLEGGLVADLQAPEFDTRLKILERKSASQGRLLPEDVARTLAHHPITNIREMNGMLTQVIARATLTKQPLTVDLACQSINRTSPQPTIKRRRTNLDEILEAAATYHQLSLDDLLSKRRTTDVVRARHVAIYLAREETESSLSEIGKALGGRNHSTILHGYKKIADEVEADADLRQEVNSIREQLFLFPQS